MRNSIRLIFAFAIALWAGSAAADVDAYATIYKTKDVTFNVNLTITKDVTVTVTYANTLTGAAEADIIVNQVNEYNRVDKSGRLQPGPIIIISGPVTPSGKPG